jgi:deoxyadenosine/deoxycytidine kinase
MQSFFLAIEGVIGVGKTTLARLLQPRFGAELLLEAFEENPFLSDFYADRARYAFQTQMFFLLSRYRQQQAAPTLLRHGPLVADYTFAKDSLFAQMNLAGDELDVYGQLYNVLADRTPPPDLVVYLRADTDLLMLRIAMRDRAYEREMDRAYIEALRQAYERHFSNYTRTPLLIVDAQDLDYVQDPGALAFIEGQVRTALGIGVHQRRLPQMEPVVGATTALVDAVRAVPGWGAVEEFITVNEAVGRVGTALAGGALEQSELMTALQEAAAGLQRLAHTAGVDLRGTL